VTLFVELAEAVFGRHYAEPLAARLGLNSTRAVYRWASGQNEAPAELILKLADWLEAKDSELVTRARQAAHTALSREFVARYPIIRKRLSE
jgi:transcriptional regulator with XRE-family HTH domain